VRKLPPWLKAAWTLWTLLWAWAYALHFGPENYLWFCNFATFIIAAALWMESPLLFSWQAVSVLLVQVLYTFDVTFRFLFGDFPIGATRFMFDEGLPLEIRLLSLVMHVGTPPVLLFGLARLGYDKRALPLQVATAAVVLVASWAFWSPERNLNWAWGPLFKVQGVMAPPLYVGVAIIGYSLILYLPSHLFFTRIWPRRPAATPN
jgi:hypothetical protein